MPTVAASISSVLTASRSPSVTFTSYTPQANDIVVLFSGSTTTSTITIPSGWVNPLGGTTDLESDVHQLCAIYHIVTPAEQAAVTVTYTATNLYDVAETGAVCAAAVRNVDPQNVVDAFRADAQPTATTAQHIAGHPATVGNGSLLVSCVVDDGLATFTTPANNWTELLQQNTNQGLWLGNYDLMTVAGVADSGTAMVSSANDEYCTITVVFTDFRPKPIRKQLNVAVSRAAFR